MALHHGDCLDVLKTLPDNSVDACVTDPPYGLAFMGKRWDYDVPSTEVWAEVLRVLKPGGHLLCFAGTRTQHRMAVRIEDAGFEIRDMLAWVYGSGFPKSHNGPWGGTALKPALEPITLARKPMVGTVAANVAQWGTGGINVDGCRVGPSQRDDYGRSAANARGTINAHGGFEGKSFAIRERTADYASPSGRWPANLLHDGSEEVVGLFPQTQASPTKAHTNQRASDNHGYVMPSGSNRFRSGAKCDVEGYGDSGSAARFFYQAKAGRKDRDEGLPVGTRSNHPTVKPTALMRWLVRLVTPPGGAVLDPFMGSGSTGKACALEGFAFVGIEREAEYLEIARARIAHATPDDDTEDTREPLLPLEASA